MFGGYSSSLIETQGRDKPETIESLRKELQVAKAQIHNLKTALGSNHPLGYKSGGLLG